MYKGKKHQRGSVAIVFTLSAVALVAVGGLAMDAGHAFVNKSRLQTALDSAALSAAKMYDMTKDEISAKQAAQATFTNNLNASGNAELKNLVKTNPLQVQFSPTLSFSAPGRGSYVRVQLGTPIDLNTTFMSIAKVDTLRVSTSAVAGPSPSLSTACDLAPMLLCAAPGGTAANNWGYKAGDIVDLKLDSSNQNSPVGKGNFQLLNLPGSEGGSDVRENLAKQFTQCVSADSSVLTTKPGNNVGPVYQGLNTRFNIYDGPMKGSQTEYPPDLVTKENISYAEYRHRLACNEWDTAANVGVTERRVLVVPIGQCAGNANGAANMNIVGFGCVFLRASATHQGGTQTVQGEIIDQCTTTGTPGAGPGNSALKTIQLYEDTSRWDS